MSAFQEKIAQATKDLMQKVDSQVVNPLVWQIAIKRSSAFTGSVSNAHGNDGGTLDPYPLFTVTGDVAIKAVVGIVNVDLVGAATLEVGVAGNTAKLLAQVSNATTLDDGDVWTDAGTEAGIDIIAGTPLFFINDGADIIETVGTTNITAGQIDYYCIYALLEPGASVVPA